MNVWTEHLNPEGRTYWFNTGTKESVWEKPDDLKTPFERALNQTKWKEYVSGGRKYYYNTETKVSKWSMPDELLLLLEKVEKDSTATTANNALVTRTTASGTQGAANPLGGADQSSSTGSQALQTLPKETNGSTPPSASGSLPFSATSILPARPNLPDDPVIPHNGFATVEEGEKAFMHLLRKAGVDATWTWDQTMRSIITDPLYKALNTLAEKKTAWQKYTDSLRAKEQEEREARLTKFRPAVRNMLKGNPNVFHYTTFATADKLFAQHPIWQQAKIESERKFIFEEYVTELKQREVQETRAARSRSINKVVALFKRLEVDVLTKWRQAHTMVVDSEEWQGDAELQKLPTLDILLAFEDYSRVREREFEEQMRRSQLEKTRKERKARELFRAVLKELVDEGKIKARTKWKQVYPLFSEDQRYLDMLGNPGSNPLELFWDLVDGMDQRLDAKITVIEEVLQRHNDRFAAANQGFKITPETRLKAFLDVVRADSNEVVQQMRMADFEEIFDTLHEQAVKQQADEKRRAERRQRHLQDDLRYALKKMTNPIDINTSYEDAVPLMEDLPEFKALEDEEGRRAAFIKYVKRQKERMREKEREASEDGGSTTSRRRKEPERDRERDRERERERERDRERERERDKDRDRDHKEKEKEKDKDKDKDKDRDLDRDRDRDRDPRSSRHHRHDDHSDYGRPSSRDYGRDRDRDYSSRDKDHYGKDKERERDKDHYKSSSRHHKDYDKDDRRRDRRGTRDWDDGYREDRERSASVYREEPREKRDRASYEEKPFEERSEKRARYEEEPAPESKSKEANVPREETPEEGEI